MSQTGTEPQYDETIFFAGVIGVVQEARVLIIEYRPGFLEADTVVLRLVSTILGWIPDEGYFRHVYLYYMYRYRKIQGNSRDDD